MGMNAMYGDEHVEVVLDEVVGDLRRRVVGSPGCQWWSVMGFDKTAVFQIMGIEGKAPMVDVHLHEVCHLSMADRDGCEFLDGQPCDTIYLGPGSRTAFHEAWDKDPESIWPMLGRLLLMES